MERYKKGEDRNQLTMEPMCLDDVISPDSEVRALELIVDKMDIRSHGFTHCETKHTGRKPYDPADMRDILESLTSGRKKRWRYTKSGNSF